MYTVFQLLFFYYIFNLREDSNHKPDGWSQCWFSISIVLEKIALSRSSYNLYLTHWKPDDSLQLVSAFQAN